MSCDNAFNNELTLSCIPLKMTGLFNQLVMRWFQYSIADFEETLNPENGSFVVMERKLRDSTVRNAFHRANSAL